MKRDEYGAASAKGHGKGRFIVRYCDPRNGRVSGSPPPAVYRRVEEARSVARSLNVQPNEREGVPTKAPFPFYYVVASYES
jgi:hypothetical protein